MIEEKWYGFYTKQDFYKFYNRYPTQEEWNDIVNSQNAFAEKYPEKWASKNWKATQESGGGQYINGVYWTNEEIKNGLANQSDNEGYNNPLTQSDFTTNINDTVQNTGANNMTSEDILNMQIQAQNNINQANLDYNRERDALMNTQFENNLSFETQKYKTQLRENEITRAREDNAVTRRMADLANAGINPLYAGILPAGVSQGMVSGNSPSIPNYSTGAMQAPQLSGFANAIVQNANSIRDNEYNFKKLELERVIADKAEKHETYRDELEERKRIDNINAINKQISLGFQTLRSNNINEGERRKLEVNLQKAEALLKKDMQRADFENEKELRKAADNIAKINTGNEIVDTILNAIFKGIDLYLQATKRR